MFILSNPFLCRLPSYYPSILLPFPSSRPHAHCPPLNLVPQFPSSDIHRLCCVAPDPEPLPCAGACALQELAEEFGRHRAREFNVGAQRADTGVRYEDVAGIDAVKADIEEAMRMVLGDADYQAMGARPPRVRRSILSWLLFPGSCPCAHPATRACMHERLLLMCTPPCMHEREQGTLAPAVLALPDSAAQPDAGSRAGCMDLRNFQITRTGVG